MVLEFPKALRLSGPFLKEFVKPKQFPTGFLRTESVWRCFLFLVRRARRILSAFFVFLSGIVSVVVATGSCNRSFPARLLPTHSFARYRSRGAVSSSAGSSVRQTRNYLVRIPPCKGHSIQSVVRLAFPPCGWKPPHPGPDSSWPPREGSQVAPGQLGSKAPDRLAVQQTIAIDPQQFAQGRGVASIGLAFLAVRPAGQAALLCRLQQPGSRRDPGPRF